MNDKNVPVAPDGSSGVISFLMRKEDSFGLAFSSGKQLTTTVVSSTQFDYDCVKNIVSLPPSALRLLLESLSSVGREVLFSCLLAEGGRIQVQGLDEMPDVNADEVITHIFSEDSLNELPDMLLYQLPMEIFKTANMENSNQKRSNIAIHHLLSFLIRKEAEYIEFLDATKLSNQVLNLAFNYERVDLLESEGYERSVLEREMTMRKHEQEGNLSFLSQALGGVVFTKAH